MLNESNNLTYLNIVNGKIAVKTDKNDSKAVVRTNKNGYVVYERLYNSITATVVGLKHIHHEEYGTQLSIQMVDETDTIYELKLPAMSRIELGFLTRLPALDLSKPITLGVLKKTNDKGSDVNDIWIYKNGNKIESVFGKDELPAFLEVKVKGKLTYDPEPTFTYLYEH